MTHARKLRELLARPGIIRTFGAHDVFSALLLEQAGVEMVFVGGFGTSASLLGLPDVDFLTLTEMAEAVRRTAMRLSIPVVADGDTGHGDLHNVARTVREFEQAGAAGVILEDQQSPKRCGHFEGKRLIAADEMVLKLRAAIDARRDPDFVLVARTDARAVEGLDAAIERARRYAAAGADVCFVEAPESRDELERIAREIDRPLLANMLVGGKTPILCAADLERIGYKFAVCPIETLLVAGAAVRRLAEVFLSQGRVDSLAGEMLRFEEVKQILGLDEVTSLRNRLSTARHRPREP